MRALLVAALMSLPPTGHATVGGPDHVEVLGYEPADGKLYFLVHLDGEIAEPPQLYFLPLDGEDPRRRRAARSWYQGPTRSAVGAAFPERLARLVARLEPTPSVGREGASIRVKHRDLRVCADARYQPKTGDEARAIVDASRRGERDIDRPVCELHEVHVEWSGYEGLTHVESWGSPSLLRIHRLPDPRFALAIVRHVGKHFEVGYTEDVPVLLRRAGQVADPAPRADDRCPGFAGGGDDRGRPDLLRPGAWLPTLDPSLVDRRWQRSGSRAFPVGHVRHVVTVTRRGGHARFAVARAVRGGGLCVVAVQEDAFGGRGVEVEVVDIARHGAQAALVFRHDRLFGDGGPDRVWSVLHLKGREATWLAKAAWQDTGRLTVSWVAGRPKLRAR